MVQEIVCREEPGKHGDGGKESAARTNRKETKSRKKQIRKEGAAERTWKEEEEQAGRSRGAIARILELCSVFFLLLLLLLLLSSSSSSSSV
jgi:hypothetical protein